MATPAELRAKLLAQRAAQQDELRKREEIHEEAKVATKNMVMLGYNFDDIMELISSEVSEEHLNILFRAIGIFRKRRFGKSVKTTPFGASRWMDRREEFIINFDEDFLSSDEDDDDDDEKEKSSHEVENEVEMEAENPDLGPVAATSAGTEPLHANGIDTNATNEARMDERELASNVNIESAEGLKHDMEVEEEHNAKRPKLGTPLDERKWHDASLIAQAQADSAHLETAPDIPKFNEIAQASHDFEHDIRMDEDAEPEDGESGTAPTISEPVVHKPLEMAASDSAQDIAEPLETSSITATEPSGSHQIHDSADIDVDEASVPLDHALDEVKRSEPVPEVSSGDSNEDGSEGEPEIAKPIHAPNEQVVQEELEKVKAQIVIMQQRKLARETQKEAEAEMARRSMELRDIASRRALLNQKREQLDLKKAGQRVSDLERKLAIAKKQMDTTSHQLQEIDHETVTLEKQELKLREELSKPRPPQQVTVTDGDSQEHEATTSAEPVQPESEEYVPDFPFLTAKDSPLRMFSSFRMCPSLGPSHWFSRSFNGRFVNDIASRKLCSNEMSNKKENGCTDPDCDYIHFSDFEIPAEKICQYMATRTIDKAEQRDALIDVIKTHLKGSKVPVEQLAASIIGFNRKYDSTRILDWNSFEVEEPRLA